MSSAQAPLNMQFGLLEESQWQLDCMQLVNFGPFDGYHFFDYKTGFDYAPTTVVAGDSGTGKSTLEDAFFEVMTRNGSYNTASNDGGRGGSLSSEKRSLIGYVRGKLADTEDEDGNQVARLLRDGSCNRWSAVVLTFASDASTCFTVAKLFWIGAGYNANADIKQLRITMYQPFDPRVLEPIAAQNFTTERLRRLIGGDFKSFSRVDEFLTYVYRVLKVDESGQGKDVFDLLGKIRSGTGFRSISELFREQVLDVPPTFARAEEAVRSYREHRDAYDKMKDKRERVEALSDVRDTSTRYEAAHSELDAHVEALREEVFGAWESDSRMGMLATYGAELEGRRTELAGQLDAANAQLEQGMAEQDSLERQLKATGYTERLAAFDAAVMQAEARLRSCNEDYKRCAQEVEPYFGKMPTSSFEFGNLQHRVRQFMDGYDDTYAEVEKKHTDAIVQRSNIDAKAKEYKEDLAYYERNKSRIPRFLGEAREALATAAGMTADELPFAAELMEVTDERWRRAVESVYGGFARTLLVSEDDFEQFSSSIDKLKLRKRMSFRRVPVGMACATQSGQGMLSQKIAFNGDSPFAGWLINTVRDEHHDALCVGTTKQLAGPGRRVTINGQTRDGNRGAHGRDEASEGIIGIDNTSKIVELQQKLVDLQAPWNRANEAEKRYRKELDALVQKHSAAQRIERFEFAQVDVAGAQAKLDEQRYARQCFLDENEELGQLEQRLGEAKAAVTLLLKQVGGLESRLQEVEGEYDAAKAQLDECRAAARAFVQVDRASAGFALLKAEGDQRFVGHGVRDNLRGFSQSVEQVRSTLQEQQQDLAKRVDDLAKRIQRQLERYLERWPDSFLAPTLDCLSDFMAQLQKLEHEGFHLQMDSWREHMVTWIKEDLIPLDVAYRDARSEIDDKLEPINAILQTLPFGREGGRLQIVCRSSDPKSARDFSALMRDLLDIEQDGQDIDEEAYHKKARRLIETIDPEDTRAEVTRRRNEVLDRRRHVSLSARVVDAHDPTKVLSTIRTLASKSGGEVAEIVAFILGAALLYRLGRDGTSKPGFAPVLLDEGFIKADSRFTSRAISAWQGFGFQLIIAVPEEKYQSVVSKAERVLNIVADADRRSYVSTFDYVAPEDVAEDDDAEQ